MNKKILITIFGVCLLVMFLLYIGADENSTNPENGILNQEGNTLPQINSDSNYSGDTLYENLDSLNNEDYSNISDITEDNNVTIEDNSSVNITISEETNEADADITSANDETTTSLESDENSLHQENSSSTEYTDLSDVIHNSSQENYENISVPPETKTNYTYYLRGKKEIDIEGYEGNGITKNEVERSELEKEVTISSEEHFEGYLRVYTSLTTEAKKEDIKIYWKNNENLEITGTNEYSVEYYDEDNNGLIDRISWTVPHLSTQVFEVVINTTKTNESLGLILLNVTGPPQQARNPIKFNINLDYNESTDCSLYINNTQYNFSFSQNYSLDLQNGYYLWLINCSNSTNSAIWNSTYGNFTINENFYSSLQEGKLYFLDLIKNEIKNPETVIINSTSSSNFVVKLIRNGGIIYTKSASNSTTLVMDSSLLNSSGVYNLSIEFNEPSPRTIILTNFSVASANLTFNASQIQEGQSVKITVNVNSPIKKITPIYLEYGDGGSDFYNPSINQFNQDFTRKYSNSGTYTVNLSVTIDGGGTFSVKKNGITVTTGKDTEAPTISLQDPTDEEVIYEPAVNFSYKANDDVKIQNCTFKLYQNCASMNYCSTNSANLLFPTTSQQNSIANNYSVLNNKKVEIKLQDFKDGIYEWLVECYDNSSNYNWEIGFFQIDVNNTDQTTTTSLNNYSQKSEVETLKAEADAFITRDYTLEEKEVLDDLNILNDTKYYKKRLIDIGDFLGENYKYVSSQELRDKKTAEYLSELANIKNRMPQDITIKENYEYIKNSVDSDLESIVSDYFASTNTKIGKSSVQKLAKINRELQNEISISAKIKSVEIEYGNETQKITLVKKQISLKNESYTKILEVIPKNIAKSASEITFLTPNKVINEDPLYEVNYEDLDKKEINYYIKGAVKLKDFESTETLLFEDNLNKFNTRFTGFFIVDLTSGGTAIYVIIAFILLVILLFASAFLFKRYRMIGWRKEPNVVRVMDLIEDINKLLKEKEIEKAREKYYRIKEIYPVLPSKTKAYFYEKINEMLMRIDKKDIFGLVKEYQEAKRNWNKEDYMRLYEDIKKIYVRLPEKDRKKVYDIINGY